MISARKILSESTAALLTVKSMPNDAESVDIRVLSVLVNKNPQIFSEVVLIIEPLNGKTRFPVNTGNIERLSKLLDSDDLENARGRVLTVSRGSYVVRGEDVSGLDIVGINEPEKKAAAKNKPK